MSTPEDFPQMDYSEKPDDFERVYTTDELYTVIAKLMSNANALGLNTGAEFVEITRLVDWPTASDESWLPEFMIRILEPDELTGRNLTERGINVSGVMTALRPTGNSVYKLGRRDAQAFVGRYYPPLYAKLTEKE